MRFRILSDLHFEHMKDYGRSFCDKLQGDEGAYLILAGDIMQFSALKWEGACNVLDRLHDKFKGVVYVLGNHESYFSSISEAESFGKKLQDKYGKLIFANRPMTTCLPHGDRAGVVQLFLGTLWFRHQPGDDEVKRFMNDFLLIDDIDLAYERNQQFKELVRSMAHTVPQDVVFVTHHLPSHQSVPRKYKRSAINVFFVDEECEGLIAQVKPRLYVHGHTHSSCDYMLEETRIVCNPYGYGPSENPPFDPNFTVEI